MRVRVRVRMRVRLGLRVSALLLRRLLLSGRARCAAGALREALLREEALLLACEDEVAHASLARLVCQARDRLVLGQRLRLIGSGFPLGRGLARPLACLGPLGVTGLLRLGALVAAHARRAAPALLLEEVLFAPGEDERRAAVLAGDALVRPARGEMGGFGGGWLEQPRQWQWDVLFLEVPSCPEPPGAP